MRPRYGVCFENISSKANSEETIQNFDKEFETDRDYNRYGLNEKKLGLEKQMIELETKGQLLEEDDELESKVKRAALKIDDVRSQ